MDGYMTVAIEEARRGIESGHGGPFGAVVVNDDGIVSRAHNRVLVDNDPTAHAEMIAIRDAARELGTYDLSGCEIHSTSEPCPMCLAAIYWSRIDALHYGTGREVVARYGFADGDIYEIIAGRRGNDRFTVHHAEGREHEALFERWVELGGTEY